MEPRGGAGKKTERPSKRESVRSPAPASPRAKERGRQGGAARDAALTAGLFVLAALVRVLFLRGTIDRDLPFSIFYYGDSRVYREFALAILRGDLYDNGIPFHPPLFAWVLSRVIAGVGENPYAMRAVLAVFGASVAPLTYLLGLRLWPRAVALTGALLTVFSFGLCVTAVSANVEALYIPMLVGQALLLTALGDALEREAGGVGVRDGRGILILTAANGALLGLGSLTRAEHLLLMPLLPLILLTRRPRPSLRRLVPVCAAAIGIGLLVIAPWSLRNARTLSRYDREHPELAEPLPVFVLITNYGALNFALANAPGSDGTFKPDLITKGTGAGQIDFGDPRQLSLYLHGYREGLGYLFGHPADAAALVARKIAIGLDAGSLGYGISNWPGGLTGTRRAVDLFTSDRKLMLPVTLVLLVAGIWVSRDLWRHGSALWWLALHKLVMCAAFFGYVRLFAHLLPFAALVQASALVGLASLARAPAVRRTIAAGGLVLGLLLFVELLAGSSRPRNFTASGSSDDSGKVIQDAPIRIAPAR
jgi:4-amino-4-deoxy-L-arabinose transferase-like glycosyltransferase